MNKDLKIILLTIYSKYFKKLAINSITNTNIQKEHLIACHVYIRVLDYYEEAERRNVLDRINIDYVKYEYTIFKLKRALQSANINYYE